MIDDPLNRLKVKRGEQLPHAKLRDDDVRQIRAMVNHREQLKRQASAMTNARIAQQYGVHVRTIDRITAGDAWTHIEDTNP